MTKQDRHMQISALKEEKLPLILSLQRITDTQYIRYIYVILIILKYAFVGISFLTTSSSVYDIF